MPVQLFLTGIFCSAGRAFSGLLPLPRTLPSYQEKALRYLNRGETERGARQLKLGASWEPCRVLRRISNAPQWR